MAGKKAKSNFTGPGRKLTSGEVIVNDNEDYYPSESDSSASDINEDEVVVSDCEDEVDAAADADPSESEGGGEEEGGDEEEEFESAEEVQHDEALGEDYIETIDEVTKKVKRSKPEMSEEARKQKQKEGILGDDRYKQSMKNGMTRAARVIKEHEANIGRAFSAIDMSDVGKKSLSAKTREARYKLCANGMWEDSGKTTKKGKKIFRLVKNATNNAALKPCGCRICLKRADFRSYSKPDKPTKSTRSGLKRGFFKYGEGYILGESDRMDKRKKTNETEN
ncbi:hypothetical protein BCIN_06g01480 [Botrytis cinerea B05.10]|uniref:Uncharacterized protein n=1 Tax=Botryotinia fuckeliana (strain B05.10) TaxID=332648 RepID=A0A384JJY0_BOTFB|nr:hypothetical protein BCIN_06g01480 [Botrytis cinerea B05.10]ATZ50654.1 hypothetical protein BCIN_06g01480 [Botrytis cinerea B05.10]